MKVETDPFVLIVEAPPKSHLRQRSLLTPMSVFTGFFAKCDRRDQEGVSVLTEIVAIFSIVRAERTRNSLHRPGKCPGELCICCGRSRSQCVRGAVLLNRRIDSRSSQECQVQNILEKSSFSFPCAEQDHEIDFDIKGRSGYMYERGR